MPQVRNIDYDFFISCRWHFVEFLIIISTDILSLQGLLVYPFTLVTQIITCHLINPHNHRNPGSDKIKMFRRKYYAPEHSQQNLHRKNINYFLTAVTTTSSTMRLLTSKERTSSDASLKFLTTKVNFPVSDLGSLNLLSNFLSLYTSLKS